jgi:hypothetical protein
MLPDGYNLSESLTERVRSVSEKPFVLNVDLLMSDEGTDYRIESTQNEFNEVNIHIFSFSYFSTVGGRVIDDVAELEIRVLSLL